MIWSMIKRGLGLAIVVALIGAAALYAGLAQGRDSDVFATADTIAARVTRLQELTRTQNGTQSTSYYVTVTVPGGQHRDWVSARFFRTLTEGDEIEIWKLDTDPPRYLIDRNALAASSVWALGVALVAVLMASGLAWLGIRNGRRDWALRTRGGPGVATVTALDAGIIPTMTFAYTDAAGQPHSARRPRPKGDFPAGSQIAILLDPQDPGNVAVAPDQTAACAP